MSMFPIASSVVGSSGATSIIFNNIPQTFTHLQIRGFASTNSGSTAALLQFNSDSAANYAYHFLIGDGSSPTSGGVTSSTSIVFNAQTTSAFFASEIIDILDYTNTNKNKTVKVVNGYDNNTSGFIHFRSGLWTSTSAITTISISSTTFQQFTRFDLYGISTSNTTGA